MLTKVIRESNTSELQPIIIAIIPILGAVLVGYIGYLINKRIEVYKETNSKKRIVYEEFLNAVTLTHFEGGLQLLIVPGSDYAFKEVHNTKMEVIKGYEKIKLWGSEGVIDACYDFFRLQIKASQEEPNITQEDMKKPYYRMIEEMRKDLNMKNITLNEKNIQIISFGRDDSLNIPKK